MFTIKHTEENGRSNMFLALSVHFDPGEKQLVAYGSPGPNEGARHDGVIRFGDGHIYVMNDAGKTVAVYVLSGSRSI